MQPGGKSRLLVDRRRELRLSLSRPAGAALGPQLGREGERLGQPRGIPGIICPTQHPSPAKHPRPWSPADSLARRESGVNPLPSNPSKRPWSAALAGTSRRGRAVPTWVTGRQKAATDDE
jgi:hypothetical protein